MAVVCTCSVASLSLFQRHIVTLSSKATCSTSSFCSDFHGRITGFISQSSSEREISSTTGELEQKFTNKNYKEWWTKSLPKPPILYFTKISQTQKKLQLRWKHFHGNDKEKQLRTYQKRGSTGVTSYKRMKQEHCWEFHGSNESMPRAFIERGEPRAPASFTREFHEIQLLGHTSQSDVVDQRGQVTTS